MANGSTHSGNECGINFTLILYTCNVYLSLNDLNLEKITMFYTNGTVHVNDDLKIVCRWTVNERKPDHKCRLG